MGTLTHPDLYFWITFAQTVVMAVGGAWLFSITKSLDLGKWAQSMDPTAEIDAIRADNDRFRADVLRRFDDAGDLQSKLGTEIQRMRGELMSKEVALVLFDESKTDRVRLHQELEHLATDTRDTCEGLRRDQALLWAALERRNIREGT